MTIEHNLGDLLYIAQRTGTAREVVKAIKIIGTPKRNHVEYGFSNPTKGSLMYFWDHDDYRWVHENDVFSNEDRANTQSDFLQAKQADEDAEHKRKQHEERIIKAKQELERAEADIEKESE